MKKNDTKGIEVLKKERKKKASVTDLAASLKKMQKDAERIITRNGNKSDLMHGPSSFSTAG